MTSEQSSFIPSKTVSFGSDAKQTDANSHHKKCKPKNPFLSPPHKVFDLLITNEIFDRFADKKGLPLAVNARFLVDNARRSCARMFLPSTIRKEFPIPRQRMPLVSTKGNHIHALVLADSDLPNFMKPPSEEVIQKITERLGINEEPKWYKVYC